MLGINNRLFMPDNGVDVLKENDPRHHGMGKPGLGGFFVVLPKVASSVKKLAGNDWRLEFDVGSGVKDGLASRTGRAVIAQRVVKRFVRRFEAGVATFEQGKHVRGHQCVGKALEGAFVFDVSQIERASGMQVDKAAVVSHGTDAGALSWIFKSNESH